MDKKFTKLLGFIVKSAESGVDTFDVFDIVYETNILYPELKPHLDELVKAGTLSAQDIKTYKFTGDVKEERAKLKGAFENKGNPYSKKKIDPSLKYLKEEPLFMSDAPLLYTVDEDDDDLGVTDGEEYVDFYIPRRKKFSRELDAVMLKTEELASDSCCKYIGEEHLLYALLICDGKAKRILNDCDVYAERYRLYYLRIITNAKKTSGFTAGSQILIDRAIEFATDINGEDAKAGTEHLLLAILTQNDGTVGRILEVMDADVPKILEKLEKAVSGNDE
ncbi:MAG: hypothetical protein HDQ88_07840 [Clostridia bacterium]|nr:hypothetical protein [Clostridia bacterium]